MKDKDMINRGDITIIFLTQNKVPENWAKYHKEMLLIAADGAPIITVSREPVDIGTNIIQTEPESAANIFWQTLRASKMATTPYIGICEDDTLYNREHYHSFRPPLDTFAYNNTRWGMLSWVGIPQYYLEHKFTSHMTLIAPRELLIEALEERFAKYPIDSEKRDMAGGELGKEWMEKKMGVVPRKSVAFYTQHPVLFFQHPGCTDPLNKAQKKRMSPIRAFDIPDWGRAEDMFKRFR